MSTFQGGTPLRPLPQGALLTNVSPLVIFRISYTGGTGNDVTFTTTLGAPASTIQSLTYHPTGIKILTGQGVASLPYFIEAATNLNPPIPWQTISTNTANGAGLYQFIDLDSFMFPQRFYRVRSP